MEIRHYLDPCGRDHYQRWFDGLRDLRGRIAILRRVQRLELAHFGDCRDCREGVRELRIDIGPGYRVYFAREGGVVVVLLGGGDKDSQERDIERAVDAWRDYRRRGQHAFETLPQP
jgi:putative addiction module killer protein